MSSAGSPYPQCRPKELLGYVAKSVALKSGDPFALSLPSRSRTADRWFGSNHAIHFWRFSNYEISQLHMKAALEISGSLALAGNQLLKQRLDSAKLSW